MACPICQKAVKPRVENESFPFCSSRCKTVDLGKWLNEEYRIPVEADGFDDEDEVSQTGPDCTRPVRH